MHKQPHHNHQWIACSEPEKPWDHHTYVDLDCSKCMMTAKAMLLSNNKILDSMVTYNGINLPEISDGDRITLRQALEISMTRERYSSMEFGVFH